MEYDKLAQSHNITGLEPHGIRKMMEKGFDVSSNGTMQDARTILLAAYLDAKSSHETATPPINAPRSKGLPSQIIKALAAEAPSAALLHELILALVCRRVSNLLPMPLEVVDAGKPIKAYGVDSMIAAELRGWFWGVLGLMCCF